MNVREILRSKSEPVVTIGPDASLHGAMRLLVEHNIGAVVVIEGGSIVGILSERDILRAGAADPASIVRGHVRDFMTRAVITAPESMELPQVMDVMTERRIRHLPVTRDGRLCGIVSIGDVVNALRQSIEAENRYLYAYIAGTPL
jgi:CBS domain-containing protein